MVKIPEVKPINNRITTVIIVKYLLNLLLSMLSFLAYINPGINIQNITEQNPPNNSIYNLIFYHIKHQLI